MSRSQEERDPERERVDELTRRVREGTATDAEREELALHAEDRQDVALALTRAEADRQLGGHWLARVEADRRIEAAETAPVVVAERAIGMTLAVGGAIGAMFVPALGVATIIGLGVLGFSVLRVRLRTAAHDPYKDIK